jgi:hypothetical protein
LIVYRCDDCLRIECYFAEDLARESAVSIATIRRAELTEDETSLTAPNDRAIRRALEEAGVLFIDENGEGPGVRLRKRVPKKPDGPIRGNYENVAAVVGVLEAAGIEFIPENGGGPGARLRTTATTPTAAPASASKPSAKTATAKKKRGRSISGL